MRLFKTDFTQKYDMFYLIGDDNILILKTSDYMKIDVLLQSMSRHSMTNYKELPARAQRDCRYANDSSEYKQTIPVSDKQIALWVKNNYEVEL